MLDHGGRICGHVHHVWSVNKARVCKFGNCIKQGSVLVSEACIVGTALNNHPWYCSKLEDLVMYGCLH
jgi:hypothetical protein